MDSIKISAGVYREEKAASKKLEQMQEEIHLGKLKLLLVQKMQQRVLAVPRAGTAA